MMKCEKLDECLEKYRKLSENDSPSDKARKIFDQPLDIPEPGEPQISKHDLVVEGPSIRHDVVVSVPFGEHSVNFKVVLSILQDGGDSFHEAEMSAKPSDFDKMMGETGLGDRFCQMILNPEDGIISEGSRSYMLKSPRTYEPSDGIRFSVSLETIHDEIIKTNQGTYSIWKYNSTIGDDIVRDTADLNLDSEPIQITTTDINSGPFISDGSNTIETIGTDITFNQDKGMWGNINDSEE